MFEAILISIGFVAMVGVTCLTIPLFGKIQEFKRTYDKFVEYRNEVYKYEEILSRNKVLTYRYKLFVSKVSETNDMIDKLHRYHNFPKMILMTEKIKEKIKWIEDNMDDVPHIEEIVNRKKYKERGQSIDEILNDNGDN